MCVICSNQPRCVKCGDFIREYELDFDEAIPDETLLPRILSQKDVCNECKLDQIKAADRSTLGYYKTFGQKTTAINQ